MPVLRACSTCSAPFVPRHGRHRHCALHEPTGNESRSPTTRTRPSSSTERERIRSEVLVPGAVCALRLDGCTTVATVADHIVAAEDGGEYVRENLEPACHHCNSAKGGSRGRQASALKHGRDDRGAGRHVPGVGGQPRSPGIVGPTRLA